MGLPITPSSGVAYAQANQMTVYVETLLYDASPGALPDWLINGGVNADQVRSAVHDYIAKVGIATQITASRPPPAQTPALRTADPGSRRSCSTRASSPNRPTTPCWASLPAADRTSAGRCLQRTIAAGSVPPLQRWLSKRSANSSIQHFRPLDGTMRTWSG